MTSSPCLWLTNTESCLIDHHPILQIDPHLFSLVPLGVSRRDKALSVYLHGVQVWSRLTRGGRQTLHLQERLDVLHLRPGPITVSLGQFTVTTLLMWSKACEVLGKTSLTCRSCKPWSCPWRPGYRLPSTWNTVSPG